MKPSILIFTVLLLGIGVRAQDSATLTLDGQLTDGAGSFSLTKGGAGTLRPKTGGQHNNDTPVSAGTLWVGTDAGLDG